MHMLFCIILFVNFINIKQVLLCSMQQNSANFFLLHFAR